MTKKPYQRNLMLVAVAAAGLALLIWLIASPRWFSFYGPATVVLVATPPLGILLWQRLETIDWRRAWTFVFVVPALALALIQIGYWLAYFSYGVSNPTLGIVRGMVQTYAGPFLPLAGLALVTLWGWLFWRTAHELP
jgi:hypothetical protein